MRCIPCNKYFIYMFVDSFHLSPGTCNFIMQKCTFQAGNDDWTHRPETTVLAKKIDLKKTNALVCSSESAKMSGGARAMVVYLKTQLQYNGREGIIVNAVETPQGVRVHFRLDTDDKELSLKVENLLLLVHPCCTQFPPGSFHGGPPPWLCPSDYVEVVAEAGKGDGVRARVDLKARMWLRDVPEKKQTCMFMPACGGWQYKSECYAIKMSTANTPVLGNNIQPMLDAIYGVLAQTASNVCVSEARYIGDLCGKGGCRNCGFSVLTMAALKQISECEMQEPISFYNTSMQNFAVDTKMLLARMQLCEILLIVDFISKHTDKMERELRTKFIDYVWHNIAVYKTNAFAAYMTLDDVSNLKDPRLPEKMRAHATHVNSWLAALEANGVKLQDKDQKFSKQESLALVIECKMYERLISETQYILNPPLEMYGPDTGLYHCLGHAVTVTLHAPYITKINGAKSDDCVNCHLVEFVHNETRGATLPDDFQTYLCIDKEVPTGQFLCMAYNRGNDADDYFTTVKSHTLEAQAAASIAMVELIRSSLDRFATYMPGFLVRHLECCISSAATLDSVFQGIPINSYMHVIIYNVMYRGV